MGCHFESILNATTNRKIILKEKLKNTQMNQGEDVTTHLTKLRQVKDELATIGDSASDDELVRIALNGFSKVSSFKLSVDKIPY